VPRSSLLLSTYVRTSSKAADLGKVKARTVPAVVAKTARMIDVKLIAVALRSPQKLRTL